ncbi:UNVERIFIED_CONTAM: hypothetical protein H355_012608, partial [Colinus virginianus]
MSKDVGNVVEALYGDLPPPIMLIGHSMGGAIAVHTAVANLVPSLLGLCMIDVVEGVLLVNVKSGQIRNLESARVSMVGQVKHVREIADSYFLGLGKGISFWFHFHRCEGAASPEGPKAIVEGIIEEEEEEEEDDEGGVSVNKRKKEDDTEVGSFLLCFSMCLRGTPLARSYPNDSGVDRLDKDLTIGQMQGKFQMQVLPQCGHAVHEDAPDKVAEAVATFLIRHRFTEPIGGFQWAEQPRAAFLHGQEQLIHCWPFVLGGVCQISWCFTLLKIYTWIFQ